jgi:calcium-dependent protein kinase
MGCGTSTSSARAGDDAWQKYGDKYVIHKEVLGDGFSCAVFKARKIGENGREYALKQIHPSKPKAKELYDMEVELLQILAQDQAHQNVLEYVDAWEPDTNKNEVHLMYYNIVTGLCEGGELFDRVIHEDRQANFTSKVCAQLAKDMFESLLHCHNLNIVHRDIKPENFVFDTNDKTDTEKVKKDKIKRKEMEDRGERFISNMRLIDFGCAKLIDPDMKVDDNDRPYSYYYVAPEVLDRKTSLTGRMWMAADCWSVGVVIYMLLTGRPPFNDSDNSKGDLYDIIQNEPYEPLSESYDEGARELISMLLNKDWTKRPTAKQALEHAWIQGHTASDNEIDRNVIRGIFEFKERCHLQKAIGRICVNRMTQEEHDKLAALFDKFDANKDGRLDNNELRRLMNYIGKGSEAIALLQHADDDGDNHVDLDEFKAMHTSSNVDNLSDEVLRQMFDSADHSGDGVLNAQEVQQLCNVDAEAAYAIIKEADTSNDGLIDVDEWISAIRKRGHKVKG